MVLSHLLHLLVAQAPGFIKVRLNARLVTDDHRIRLIPIEIRHGTFNMAVNYITDLMAWRVATYRSKIMFLGLQSVGKTSLNNAFETRCAAFVRVKMGGLLSQKWQLVQRGPNLFFISKDTTKRILLDSRYDCRRHADGNAITIRPSQAHVKHRVFRGGDPCVQWPSDEELMHAAEPSEFAVTLELHSTTACHEWYAMQ
jgi:hypothetical protein